MDIDEKELYKWDSFEDYCAKEGISLEHLGDWVLSWECWKTAINAIMQE